MRKSSDRVGSDRRFRRHTFRRILGAALVVLAGLIVYFGTIAMKQLGETLPLAVLGAAVFPFGFGWFLLTGARFFPNREEAEQERDEDET